MSLAEAFYSPSIRDQGNLINYWIKLEASTELQIPARELCYRGIYNIFDYQPLDLQGYSRKIQIRQFFLCVFNRGGKKTANTYFCFSLWHSVLCSNIVLYFQLFLRKYVSSQERELSAFNIVYIPSTKSQSFNCSTVLGVGKWPSHI